MLFFGTSLEATFATHGQDWVYDNQHEGDLWLYATTVNGIPLKKACWLAIVHKGKTLTELM